MEVQEQVLGAEKGVRERAVGGVDEGGEGEGFAVPGLEGVFVRVVERLRGQVFMAEGGEGDSEGA